LTESRAGLPADARTTRQQGERTTVVLDLGSGAVRCPWTADQRVCVVDINLQGLREARERHACPLVCLRFVRLEFG